MEEDDDVHLCLSCHTTITGLENYVTHKKYECPSKKSKHLTALHSKPTTKNLAELNSFSTITAHLNELCHTSIDSSCRSTKENHAILRNEHVQKVSNDNGSITQTVSSDHISISSQTNNTSVSFTSYETSQPLFSPDRYQLEIFNEDGNNKNVTYTFPVSSHAPVDPNLVIQANSSQNSNAVIAGDERPKEKGKHETNKESAEMPDAASVAEFFSSLELRIRHPADKQASTINEHDQVSSDFNNVNVPSSTTALVSQKEDAFEERLKNIKIANILTDLHFSSDSEGLPSDVDDLLNFSDEDDDYRYSGGKWKPGGNHPSANHTKGKWKPSGKLTSYGKHAKKANQLSGKWKPGMFSPNQAGGKWKSGQRVSHGQGKHGKLRAYKVHRGLTDSEDEEQKSPKTKHNRDTVKYKSTSYCEICKKSFKSVYYLNVHKSTPYHKKRERDNGLQDNDHKYVLRNQNVGGKQSYTKHLLSEHTDICKTNKLSSLDPSSQELLLKQKAFNCKVCCFYCDIRQEFYDHINSDEHVTKCSELLGPIHCKRCQFYSKCNDDLIEHVKSESHEEIVSNSNKPCIIKEYRTNLKCENCDKILSSYTKLCDHMKSAHSVNSNRPLKQRGIVNKPRCPYCELQCRNEATLNIHVRRKHTGEKPFACDVCMVGFATNSDLQRHFQSGKHIDIAVEFGTKNFTQMKRKQEKDTANSNKKLKVPKKCKYEGCTHEEVRKKDMMTHYKEAHSIAKRFVCELCGYAVNHKSHYDSHCKTKRHLELVEASLQNNQLVIEENSLKCSICNLVFKDSRALHKHKVTHVVTTEENLIKKSGGNELHHIDEKYHEFIKNISSNPDEKVICPEKNCEKVIKRKLVTEHLRTHTDYKPFECIYCEKSFHRGERLRVHLQTHFPTTWHRCDYCSSKFRGITSLKQHILSHHPDHIDFEAEFICSTCGYKCMTGSLLRAHMISHMVEEEKKYRCPWAGCSKYFQFKSAMTYHIRRHTQEKLYLCDQCGFAAIDQQHLNRHKRRHTGIRNYKCEYCTYSYFNSSGLRRHMRLHINARPFKCPYKCSFTSNSIEHIRKHVNYNRKHVANNEFLYPCRHCDDGFKSQSNLMNHMVKEHNIEVTHKDTNILSLHPHILQEGTDLKSVPAGQRVNPVAEKFIAKKWKQKSESCIVTDDGQPGECENDRDNIIGFWILNDDG